MLIAQVIGVVDFVTILNPDETIASPMRIAAEIVNARIVAVKFTLSLAPNTRIPITK